MIEKSAANGPPSMVSSGSSGNKLNLRLEYMEGLLREMGVGQSARANSLKQAIRENKADMAAQPMQALDLMRQIFQPDIDAEIGQMLERHLRTTFSPAIENLRRNGMVVGDAELNALCRSILEYAKLPYWPGHEVTDPNAHLKRRPATQDSPATQLDQLLSNSSSLWVAAPKVENLLGLPNSALFQRYPALAKVSLDDADRAWLGDLNATHVIPLEAVASVGKNPDELLGVSIQLPEQLRIKARAILRARSFPQPPSRASPAV